VKILLDENMARKLLAALQAEGHEEESIQTLRMLGLDNGTLYRFACESFDLCFTRDLRFARSVKDSKARLKLIRVTLRQKRQEEFIVDFLDVFRATNFDKLQSGDDWPPLQ
jgi:DNA repair protein RadC